MRHTKIFAWALTFRPMFAWTDFSAAASSRQILLAAQ